MQKPDLAAGWARRQFFVRFGDPARPGLLDALGVQGRQTWPWLGVPDVYSVTRGATQVPAYWLQAIDSQLGCIVCAICSETGE